MQHTSTKVARKPDVVSAPSSGSLVLALLVMMSFGSSSVRAGLIAAWNFNGVESGVRKIEAVAGSGSLSLLEMDDGWDLYQGTMTNAMDGWVAGDALGIRGQAMNGTGMEFVLGAGLDSGGVFSYAARRSGTGFTTVSLKAFDGAGWVGIGSEPVGEKWFRGGFDLPPWLADFGSPLLRLEIDGARSAQGTIRFDNMIIEATVVPGPSAMWVGLLGHGFLPGRRRGTSLAGRR